MGSGKISAKITGVSQSHLIEIRFAFRIRGGAPPPPRTPAAAPPKARPAWSIRTNAA